MESNCASFKKIKATGLYINLATNLQEIKQPTNTKKINREHIDTYSVDDFEESLRLFILISVHISFLCDLGQFEAFALFQS